MARKPLPAGPLRVVIAGGGTGGHLYPGIAVARELLLRVPDAIVSFAGTAKGIEARVVPREGFALDLIRSAGLKGKSITERALGLGLLPLGGADASALLGAAKARSRDRRGRIQLGGSCRTGRAPRHRRRCCWNRTPCPA